MPWGRLPVYWLTDMDGVLVHEGQMVPGADGFLDALRATNRRFLVLTNNPIFTQRDLSARLARTGLDVPEDCIWTSATATAQFLQAQRPNGTAFVIGEAGLTTALHEVGYVLVERDPDYVVLGETRTLLVRADNDCGTAHRGGGPLHLHQPGRHRSFARRNPCRP